MKRRAIVFVSSSLLALSACTRTPEPPAQQSAAVARASSELGTLELSIDRTELSTVERLHVTLVLDRKPGVGSEDLEFHPEEAGWTLIESQATEPKLRDADTVEARWEFVLEPFLDGEYQIPPATIELHDDNERATLSTAPEPIRVTSVLADGKATIAPARTPVDVDEEPASTPAGVIAVSVACGVGLVVAAGIAWWRVRRSRQAKASPQSTQEQGPRAPIAAIRRELADTLSRKLGSLPPGATSEDMARHASARLDRDELEILSRLLAGIDQLAYGPREPTPQDIESLRVNLRRLQREHHEVSA